MTFAGLPPERVELAIKSGSLRTGRSTFKRKNLRPQTEHTLVRASIGFNLLHNESRTQAKDDEIKFVTVVYSTVRAIHRFFRQTVHTSSTSGK